MIPQEIADYKQRWMSTGNNNPVRLHSDLDITGKDWCRKHIQRHQWSFSQWTDVYEHTFYFELEEHAAAFIKAFTQFTNQTHSIVENT
jgi:hypothetical protein